MRNMPREGKDHNNLVAIDLKSNEQRHEKVEIHNSMHIDNGDYFTWEVSAAKVTILNTRALDGDNNNDDSCSNTYI